MTDYDSAPEQNGRGTAPASFSTREKKQQFQQETKAALLARVQDPRYLPTRSELTTLFADPTQRKAWESHCAQLSLYEVPTQEFITSFGRYVQHRAKQLGATAEKPLKIVEVGAGNGALTHFLRQQLATDREGQSVEIAATNKKTPFWSKIADTFPVEDADYEDAIRTHTPDIVVCAWMPKEEDWTPIFRQFPSVKEYILIGANSLEKYSSGTEKTWGINRVNPHAIPEYQRDGFSATDLTTHGDIVGQLNRFDPDLTKPSSSHTVSFQRTR